jgi:hypothetical protein
MSLRADMYRQKAAEAKRGASKKPIHETGIRRNLGPFLVLAEQMEWIESRKASAPQTEK